MPKKKRRTLLPNYPCEPQQVCHWPEEISWQIVSETGVQVFHDYLREKRRQHGNYAALLELGACCCRQEPYLSLGRHIRVAALKSQARSRRCKNKV